MGPSTDPWGTPLNTCNQDDTTPLMRTLCILLWSHSLTHCNTLPLISRFSNFKINLLCGTLSNAFTKSRNITSMLFPESTEPVTLSKNDSRFDRHDRPFLISSWDFCHFSQSFHRLLCVLIPAITDHSSLPCIQHNKLLINLLQIMPRSNEAATALAAPLRVARVTAGVAESNGSLRPGLWLTSPAGWLQKPGSAPEPYTQ